MRRGPTPRTAVLVGCLAGFLALTGCGSGSSAGPREGREQATVGSAVVGYPNGWTVLAATDRPQGWDWAAQPAAGGDAGDATTQLAVDGDYSHAPSSDLAVANLLAAAQVGALPQFAVKGRSSTEVPGAADAVQVTFGYRAGGKNYDGLWVVARSADSRVIAVQLTGISPLNSSLVDDVRHSIRVSGS